MDYTQYGLGTIFFFPLSAILSVPLVAAVLSIAIRGYALADNKTKYLVLLIITALLAIVFLPAVVTYKWFGIDSPYQGLYHSIGYVGGIILYIVALSIGGAAKLGGMVRTALLPMGIAVGYLVVGAIGATVLGLGSTSFMSPYGSEPGVERGVITSYVLGIGYASIMFIYPLLASIPLMKNAPRLREERHARLAKPVAVPVAAAPTVSLGSTDIVLPSDPVEPAAPVTSVAPVAPSEPPTNEDTLNRQ